MSSEKKRLRPDELEELKERESELQPEYGRQGDELRRDRDKLAPAEADRERLADGNLGSLKPDEEKELLTAKEKLREMDVDPES